MKPDPVVSAWRRLAVKRGVSLGVLVGTRSGEYEAALAAASLSIPGGRPLTERDVNAALRGWLEDTGAMLAVDHVELRRWLVDTGLWRRDGYGRAYERCEPPAPFAAAVGALAAVDADRLAADARAEAARERERRRSEHERRGSERG
ncbi:MAG: DUF2087 domain-containing protein [Burkholderiales bacterium]